MNSKPKSSLEFSEAQLEQYAENTILEVLPEKTGEDMTTKYVLIKHDYYSSDNEHGRKILEAFLQNLCSSSFNTIIVYLIDTGTKLLDSSNPLYDQMCRLSERSEMVIACKESLDNYHVEINDEFQVVTQSMKTLTEDLICFSNLLTLE